MKKETLYSIKRNTLSGFYRIGRLIGLNKNMVSILCYHGISENSEKYSLSKKSFEKQIEKISKHAEFISMEEAVGVLNGAKIKGPAVLLTFDDGFANLMEIAPLIRKYDIKPAIFILSDPESANKTELNNDEKLLTVEEIIALHKNGWTIGCHSATHADFSILNQDEAKKQIIGSKLRIENKLGIKIDYFAYPKGIFNENTINIVKEGGYKAAFSALPGCITEKSNRWILPRTVIDSSHHIDEFPTVYSQTNFFIRKITDRFKIWDRFFNV